MSEMSIQNGITMLILFGYAAIIYAAYKTCRWAVRRWLTPGPGRAKAP